MNIIFELEENEKKWWKDNIKKYRKDIVKKPTFYIEEYIGKSNIKLVQDEVSKLIIDIREGAWELYLIDEAEFHVQIFNHLIQNREVPTEILTEIFEKNKKLNLEELELIKNTFGEYVGRIMPYLYEVSLSTTNSRRSRAGKTFEEIISYVMKLYDYPYAEQSSLGSRFYEKNGLGKLVDGIIPSGEEYYNNRSMCCVISMKTTLRERWQEVVEEISRTNLPLMYLLTLDKKLTTNVLNQIKQQNITIVNLDEEVEKFGEDFKNIISYNDFFNKRIPHHLSFWR